MTTHTDATDESDDATTPEIPEAELLSDLKRVARLTAGVLSEREYADRGAYGVTTFRRRFGSWNAAKRRADLRTRDTGRIDDEELAADVRRVADAVDGSLSERTYADRGAYGVTTLRRRFGSWTAAKRRADAEATQAERSPESVADDIARVAGELEDGYVTPERYADRGTYRLSNLPANEPFWDDLRSRVGLAITPLYHKIVRDSDRQRAEP